MRGVGGYQAPHATICGALRGFFREAGFHAELEARRVLGDNRRPGDVLAHAAAGVGEPAEADADEEPAGARQLAMSDDMQVAAIDVTIVSTQAAGVVNSLHPGAVEAALRAAERRKRRQYTADCQRRGVTFTPFALTEFGSLGPAARGLLSRLAQRAAHSPDAHYADGRTPSQRYAALMRRWTTALARATAAVVDRRVQSRLVAACGVQAALRDSDTIDADAW